MDLLFILLPPFLVLAAVLLFPKVFGEGSDMQEWQWLVFVVLIDVAHVYSSLYRTYIDKLTVMAYRRELVIMPVLLWVAMVFLYSMGALLFWRCLAYLAVFHFIRQQYGFMRLYQRKEQLPVWKRKLDALTVYSLTVLPVVYWHVRYPRDFHWFVNGDFLGINLPVAGVIVKVLFFLVVLAYLMGEYVFVRNTAAFNWPRNLLIAGTGIVWYLGIVHYNGDMTFTLFNVVAHGVPYMALVWIFGRKKYIDGANVTDSPQRKYFTAKGLVLFLGLIFLLAYVEEGFWNSLVWDEHKGVFPAFASFPQILSDDLLTILVPTLSLPQVTHYMIDAFIWKMKDDRDRWQHALYDFTSGSKETEK